MIAIDADVSKAQRALQGTSKSLKSIERKTLSIASRGTVKAIKIAIRGVLKRRTGELLKCYGYKVHKDGVANVFPKGKTGSKVFPKAYTLNYGYKGKTKRAWNKPHSFIEKGEAFAASGAYMPEVEKMISKELEKYWGN